MSNPRDYNGVPGYVPFVGGTPPDPRALIGMTLPAPAPAPAPAPVRGQVALARGQVAPAPGLFRTVTNFYNR